MITEPLTLPDHREIRDLVAAFADASFSPARVRAAATTAIGYDDVAWKQMIDLGWTSLGIDQSAGGDGLGAVVQCIVHRELGARLVPSPFLATAGFASAALEALAAEDLAQPLLERIADGGPLVSLVLGRVPGWPDSRPPRVAAREDSGAWTLHGEAALVLDGSRADTLVVIAETDVGLWHVFRVEADAIETEVRATVDITRSFADVTFDASPARKLSVEPVADDAVSALIDKLAVLLAAELVGAAASCLGRTLDYLKTRHQFGRAIGSFQALKHRCADLAVSVSVAQELVFSAAELIDARNHGALSLAAPLALARAGEVAKKTTEEAIQLHGGIGFTEEIDIGLYYKRTLSDLEIIASPVDAFARMEFVRGGRSL